MTHTHRIALLAAVLTAALGCVACDTEQEPGTTVVVGDSITFQAAMGGAYDGTGWDAQADLGDTAWDRIPDLQASADAGQADRVVIALGTNDAAPSNDGWNAADVTAWGALLEAAHDASCIVTVLPYVDTLARPTYEQEVDEARSWLAQQGDVVVDWQPYAQRPNVLADDGVHLRTLSDDAADITPEAKQARLDVTTDGLNQCEEAQ